MDEAACSFTNDGRFLVDDNQRHIYGTPNGIFEQKKGAETQRISISDALNRPGVLGVAMQAARYNHKIFDELGIPTLDGGDYVDGQPTTLFARRTERHGRACGGDTK